MAKNPWLMDDAKSVPGFGSVEKNGLKYLVVSKDDQENQYLVGKRVVGWFFVCSHRPRTLYKNLFLCSRRETSSVRLTSSRILDLGGPVWGNPPSQGEGLKSRVEEEHTLALCEALIDVSAALFNVSSKELRKPGRSTLSVSRVRQVAMYVAHVVLGLNMTDIGKAFGRDRTTVMYACHLIEDLRDDDEFDRIITQTERVAYAAFGARRGR